MSTDVALFKNIENINIGGGTFTLNVVESVDLAFSTTGTGTVIPQGRHMHLLLAKAQQLMGLLPTAHLELARHYAGWGKRRSTTHDLGNNILSVGVPLFTSSLFASSPTEVQFVAFYILVAMVVLDILHPLIPETRTRPSSIVHILDALGKYHEFPWAACQNFTAFHAEFAKRSRNLPGYIFVKSRWYEVEYNDQILQQDGWNAVKPFTQLFVDFVIIQHKEVRCPWCKSRNSLPSSSEESKYATCSCTQCDREFIVTMNSSPAIVTNRKSSHGDDLDGFSPGHNRISDISEKILRLRIKLQSSARPRLLPHPTHPYIRTSGPVTYGDPVEISIEPPSRTPSPDYQEDVGPGAFLSPNHRPAPLPPADTHYIPVLSPRKISTSGHGSPYQSSTAVEISIEPPTRPHSPIVLEDDGGSGAYLSPNHRIVPISPVPIHYIPMPPPPIPRNIPASGPHEVEISIEPPSRISSPVDHEDGEWPGAFLSPNLNHRPMPLPQDTPFPILHRIRRNSKASTPSPYEYDISGMTIQPDSPVIPGVTMPFRRNNMTPVIDGPLPPGFVYRTFTDSNGVTTQPDSPVVHTIPLPQMSPRGVSGNSSRSFIDSPLPNGFVPQTITDLSGASTPIWPIEPPLQLRHSTQASWWGHRIYGNPLKEDREDKPRIYDNPLNEDGEEKVDSSVLFSPYVPRVYPSEPNSMASDTTPAASPSNLPGPVPIYAPTPQPLILPIGDSWGYSSRSFVPPAQR